MANNLAPSAIHTEVFGAGPTIWLLHSLLADAGSCRPLAAGLAPDYRVVLPDLPGFGGSPAAGAELHTVADRVAASMRRDGAPALLLGNGYGSFVALLVALRHPGLVQKLILVGTGAAFSEPGRQAFRNMAAGAAARGLGAIADVAMRRLFAPEFQAANPDLLAQCRARFLQTDADVFAAACAALAALDLRAEVGTITAPTLILVGDGDEATPAPMAEELAGLLPDARLKILPGLAHVPQLQDTDRFLAVMDDFIRY